MNRSERPLIVGAGPVGLGAAVFLAQQDQIPRIIDMRVEPEHQSRALAVNPRTLEILESTGVTQQMLKRGLQVHGAQFHQNGRVVGGISFDRLHPRFPYMLALSQETTERLLTQALEAMGGTVERGMKCVDCRNVDDGVEAVLESANGPRETEHYPWLLAADGARSLVRERLGVDFAGSTFANEWYLADAPLRTALTEDHAHAFLKKGGEFLFLIRVVDDVRQGPSRQAVWRVIGNRPEPLSRLVDAEQIGPPVWSSSFQISHKILRTLSVGAVFFAGDAAHLHSPAGARGMNLGLEDAWVLAKLAATNRLADYNRLRRPVDLRVVGQIELLSRLVDAQSYGYRLARACLFPVVTRIPFIRSRMVTTLTGLDHPLPDLSGKKNMAETVQTAGTV